MKLNKTEKTIPKSTIGIITGLIALFLIMWFFFNKCAPRIAYVETDFLMENYEGIKDLQKLLSDEGKQETYVIDSLRTEFNIQLQHYQAGESKSFNGDDIDEVSLGRMEWEIKYRTQELQQQQEKKQMKLMQGIVNQMNEVIESYAKKEGYDIVYGATASGNIVYGNSAYDISAQVLDELNRKYQ